MADLIISALAPAGALSAADLLEIEQGTDPSNTSGKVTLEALRAFALTSAENLQTGTSYTLVLADAFKLVAMDNAAANALTVPADSSVDFPLGTRIDLSQDGAGQTTVVADTGVTIRTPETLKIRKRYGKATLIKRAADIWDLEGNLEAAP
ncbi:hypothetical protein [uncultured Luteimonas sp.]|uniref:hypothetical protein n=1 Tax=uncultured Luteimonas sp. TaxID=453144 RepID=UPI00261E6B6B|nr:hypothetical protein [uncultured Luteimonas sp.]